MTVTQSAGAMEVAGGPTVVTHDSGNGSGAAKRGMSAVAESARLAALERYDVLDSPAEASFDRITALVRTVLGVPMAAVSLIDSDRQWFKSHPGIEASETPRGWRKS